MEGIWTECFLACPYISLLKQTELSKSSTLTMVEFFEFDRYDRNCEPALRSGKCMTFVPVAIWLALEFWSGLIADHLRAHAGPCFFWIKSSAKRAFGECLGSKRRWKTWYSAISHEELRISFDPWISEWGNPPDTLLLLYFLTALRWDDPACWRDSPRASTECS